MKHLLLILSILLIQTSCKSKHTDYVLLNKILDTIPQKKIYLINQGYFYKKPIENYLFYKKNGIGKGRVIINYNKQKDSIIYLKGELRKEWDAKIFHSYKKFGNLFSLEEIIFLMKQHGVIIWQKKLIDNQKVILKKINKKDLSAFTIISKPLYNISKTKAIVFFKNRDYGIDNNKVFGFETESKKWKLKFIINNYPNDKTMGIN